ncbi:hypothetical protein BDN71DRAFT_1450781 [Pleurotus eryngii]|uniref:Uncharacterized protein n=1 Tax=Pleurotus eryngii TaxID=5323 RepID=A0A9P6DDN2_PLEER|nr:hypothetical protein BDN71DRAFT_1450781 [Pleurotus eryngii]
MVVVHPWHMSSDRPVDDIPPSEWHSVRPWSPRLSLSVREITSVSATFILSSTFSDRGEQDLLLESLDIAPDDEFEEHIVDVDDGRAIISDALARGLSVNVNGNPWSKVIFHIDDKSDEAIIIIYALMPGRQYDIDLGLVNGGQSLRRQVVTEVPNHSPEFDHVPSPEASLPTPPTPTNPTVQTYASITLEERLAQLQHTLSTLTAEHETLTTNFKAARRDAQKADATLRSEIDILKRASEKNAVSEHRARQKVLALQEAIKRAQATTVDIQNIVQEVEEALPVLREQKKCKEEDHAKVKEAADRARREVEKENESEKKRVEALKNELAGLGHRMDKLNGKKEKLENAIPDLEEQLREVEKEIEQIEMDPYGQLNYVEENDVPSPSSEQRSRQASPGVIGRPSQTSVQRPTWTPSRSSRRSSINSSNPLLPLSAPRTPAQPSPSQQPHSRQTQSHRRSHSGGSITQILQTPQISPNHGPLASTSTLSSKAPPFEPGKPIRGLSLNTSHSSSSSHPAPIQRPVRNIHGSKDSLNSSSSR